MSIKIYNGYKLNKMSMSQLSHFIQTKLRPAMEEALIQKLEKTIDKVASWDMPVQKRLQKIYNETFDLKQKNSPYRGDTTYDFKLDVTFFESDKHTLMMVYTECFEYFDALKAMPEVEQYYYWNNTDKPDDISYEDWKARGKEWDSVLHSGIPAYDGFAVKIFDYTDWDLSKKSSDFIDGLRMMERESEKVLEENDN